MGDEIRIRRIMSAGGRNSGLFTGNERDGLDTCTESFDVIFTYEDFNEIRRKMSLLANAYIGQIVEQLVGFSVDAKTYLTLFEFIRRPYRDGEKPGRILSHPNMSFEVYTPSSGYAQVFLNSANKECIEIVPTGRLADRLFMKGFAK